MYKYLSDVVRKNGYAKGAHRGCTSCCNENSLKSIHHTAEKGFDYVEIDIQMSSDGVLFAYHDLTTCEIPNHLCTWKQIESRTNALKFETLLSENQVDKKYLMLDIKTDPFKLGDHLTKMVPEFIALLDKYDYSHHVVFISVDHQFLDKIKKANKDIMTGVIVPFVPHDPVELCRQIGAQLYLTGIRNLNQDVLRQLSGSGILIDASVVRTQDIPSLVDLGITMFELDN